ncbi:MAG: sugar nucleotide-binding protein [bacterium]
MTRKRPKVVSIATDEYPTLAKRPLNSILDCGKLAKRLKIGQPDWHIGLGQMMEAWKQSNR